MRGTKQNVTDCPQTAKEAIIAWHLEGTIGPWNGSAEQLYGYLADEIIGQSVSRLLPVDDLEELTLIAERIRRGETIEDFETRPYGKTVEPLRFH